MFNLVTDFINSQKKKLLSLHVGKDNNPHVPDIVERFDEAEALCAKLSLVTSRIPPEFYSRFLTRLAKEVNDEFHVQLGTDEEIAEAAKAASEIPQSLLALKGALEAGEAWLTSK